MAACTLVSMCPFQYGVDFGIIGGLQAMPGFLEVCMPPVICGSNSDADYF